MSALEMQVKLYRLRRSYGHEFKPVNIPLSPPTARPQVLTGLAAATTVDLVRNKLRGFCFGTLRPRDVPLFFKHQTDREVGKIDNLGYSTGGNVVITATVTDEMARRCNAFSVAATVRRFEMVNADSPDYYALITDAVIDEISLVTAPANPSCRVLVRRDTSAQAATYSCFQDYFVKLSQMLTLIKETQYEHSHR